MRGNPDVRVIALPSPDRPAREAYLDIAFPDLAAPELDRPREKLVDTTDRMLLTELDELRRLYAAAARRRSMSPSSWTSTSTASARTAGAP